jgi:endonuclease/exonuclease/phosphatase family protein
VTSIPEIPERVRREVLAGPATPAQHARWLDSLGFAGALDVVAARAPLPESRDSLRVVAWNAQRCREPARAAEFLRASGASVFLLSELDVGMARSGQAHTPRELAGRLGCSAAFAVEFLELGLGDATEQRQHAGRENSVGYHGGAVLARGELLSPEVLRLERSGRWFDGRLGERRVGTRIAVLSRVALGARELWLASLHLESHSDPDERAAQLGAVFDRLDQLAPGAPALVGGDANTHSLGRAELEDREVLRSALVREPSRLTDPVAHEPLFALAEARGFQWRPANLRPAPTYKRNGRGALQLDWFFARGLEVSDPAVLPSDDLSDHDAIALSVRPAQGVEWLA